MKGTQHDTVVGMSEDRWAQVDEYIRDVVAAEDAGLRGALDATAAARMPAIQVSAPQGKFLQLIARAVAARRILEIGTLAGYSTIWLARALPAEGKLISLELDPRHAEVARANLDGAGLAELVEVRIGAALDNLQQLVGEGAAPFDLIFIDADKEGYSAYLQWSLRLSRPGTLIIADNVVRGGAVVEAQSDDPRVQGVRRFNELLASDPRVSATILQTVGSKGYDGLAIALVER
jgi:predicted O-methyltransferase YrrM